MVDRFPLKLFLFAFFGWVFAGSLVCGLAPDIGTFIAGRALVGLIVGGEWARCTRAPAAPLPGF